MPADSAPFTITPEVLREVAGWSETTLRQVVLSRCGVLGLDVNYQTRDRLSPVKGWPDLEIVGRGGILYRELKDMRGTPSANQWRIRSILHSAGANWDVWRPVDYGGGRIDKELLAITGRS